MAPAKPFHVLVHRPDQVPVPSLSSAVLGSDLSKIQLTDIRNLCRLPQKFAFSSDGKTTVGDDTSLEYYISLTPENNGEKKGNADQHAGGESAAIHQITVECVSTSPSNEEKKEHLAQSALQSGLKELLGSGFTPVEGLKMDNLSEKLGALAALEDKWVAKAGGGVFTEAADLTAQQWEHVLFNNRVLQGYNYVASRGFVKAPKRAFIIRRPLRAVGPSAAEIAHTSPKEAKTAHSNDPSKKEAVEGSTDEGSAAKEDKPAPGKKPDTKSGSGDPVKEDSNTIPGVPHFYVDDDSHVEITEIKNGFQQMLARQGFNSEAIEANAAVGAMEAGISASVNKANEHSYDSLKVDTETATSLHVSYNFPRVVLQLDPDTLQLSDECLKDVRSLKNDDDVHKFYQQYGVVFATRLSLGGCLHSTRHISDHEKSKMDAIKDETRWAAGASFSSPKFSAGVNYANTKSTTNKDGSQTVERSARLTWEARGGDTVLCSDPGSWAYSVKDYRFWRVMQQSDLESMGTFFQKVDTGAFAHLTHPHTSDELNHRTDRDPKTKIMSRMTAVINGHATDSVLSIIISHWEKTDSAKPEAFNQWYEKQTAHKKIPHANMHWNELDKTQQTYYGLFLQLERKLRLVG